MQLQKKEKEEPEINLAPLIDVVFLLLIFFMVTTTFERQARLRIELPEASEEAVTIEQDRLEIAISEDGRFFINNNEVINRGSDTLKDAISRIAGDDREQPVTIRADASTPYQAVVTAMDAVNQLGFANLSIATTPESG
ncbi:MAG: biopolymer transporter ExbD [Pseudomonadota bacterium]